MFELPQNYGGNMPLQIPQMDPLQMQNVQLPQRNFGQQIGNFLQTLNQAQPNSSMTPIGNYLGSLIGYQGTAQSPTSVGGMMGHGMSKLLSIQNFGGQSDDPNAQQQNGGLIGLGLKILGL